MNSLNSAYKFDWFYSNLKFGECNSDLLDDI